MAGTTLPATAPMHHAADEHGAANMKMATALTTSEWRGWPAWLHRWVPPWRPCRYRRRCRTAQTDAHLGPRPFLMKYAAGAARSCGEGLFHGNARESSTSLNLVAFIPTSGHHIQNSASRAADVDGGGHAHDVAGPDVGGQRVISALNGEISPILLDWLFATGPEVLKAAEKVAELKNFSPMVRYRPVPTSSTNIPRSQTTSLAAFLDS